MLGEFCVNMVKTESSIPIYMTGMDAGMDNRNPYQKLTGCKEKAIAIWHFVIVGKYTTERRSTYVYEN
jgi:hypothetical protein